MIRHRFVQAADQLDQDWDKLWTDKYSDFFLGASRKYHYLQPDGGSAEDLFQDLWINVWTKAVDRWQDYYSKSKAPNMDAWVRFLLRNYLTDISRKRLRVKDKAEKLHVSLDAPIPGSEWETSRAESIPAPDFAKKFRQIEDTDMIDKIMDAIDDPDQQLAIRILLADEPETDIAKMELIKEQTGRSPHQLLRLLNENPAIRRILQPTNPSPIPDRGKKTPSKKKDPAEELEPV